MVDESSELMRPVEARIRRKIKDSMSYFGERGDEEDEDSSSTPKTIFPIPSLVRQTDPRLYEPTLLSIGPYHRELKAFDHHKALFLHKLLLQKAPGSLEDCITAVTNLEPEARRCYEETETFRLPRSRDDLVQLLVMDGCFIINLFYMFSLPDLELELWGPRSPLMVWNDLLKLENQIPFFVLEALFRLLLFPSIETEQLGDIRHYQSNDMLRFFASYYLTQVRPEFPNFMSANNLPFFPRIHHLLHLYYLGLTSYPQEEEVVVESNRILLADSLILSSDMLMAMIFSPHRLLRSIFMKALASRRPPPFSRRRPPALPEQQPSITIPCATQLQEDGVKFVKKRKCFGLYDVTFSRRRGIMRIPQLRIHSDNVALFANLIHYEQRQCKVQIRTNEPGTSESMKKYLTSYMFLMNCLLQSPKDAVLLRKSEIIVSEQDDEEVVEIFNQIRRICDVTRADYFYYHLLDEVKEYRKFKLLIWRAYFAQLKRDYFGSPWTVISFLAALILLCLTIVQTFFTIYRYYHPRSRSTS